MTSEGVPAVGETHGSLIAYSSESSHSSSFTSNESSLTMEERSCISIDIKEWEDGAALAEGGCSSEADSSKSGPLSKFETLKSGVSSSSPRSSTLS